MDFILNTAVSDNVTSNVTPSIEDEVGGISFTIMLIQSTIASVGIVSNFTVIISFLNQKILRKKIPNKFITRKSSCVNARGIPPAV